MTPFEADNLQVPVIDAAGELAFARALTHRSAFSAEQLAAIDQNIHQVETRAIDETLYLAILGEFSSGKSTFINALLRRRLLKSAPQATTAAATFIRFGAEFSLKLQWKDGTVISGAENDWEALKRKILSLTADAKDCPALQDALNLVTADPNISRQISQVDVTVAAANLRGGNAIIDTPGIGAGSNEARHHQAVTERVMADCADAAVILISADDALTATLLKFLDGTTRRFLHRCVFVITKMDHLDESDRADVVEYVESKLNDVIGRRPLVLQSAAATMLPLKDGAGPMPESWAYWRASFPAMERTLEQELARNRRVIIAERLTALLHSLLCGLQDATTAKRVRLAQERAALERNSVTQLERVLGGLWTRCRSEIEQEAQTCRLRILDDADRFDRNAFQTATELLNSARKDNLKEVVEEEIPAAINAHQCGFDTACESHFESLRKRCERVQNLFVAQFESSYQNLRALGVGIGVPKFEGISGSIPKGHFSGAGDFLKTSEKARVQVWRNRGMFGGCMLAPGAATAGAVCGALAGCAFSNGSAGGGLVGFFVGGGMGFIASIVIGGSVGGHVGSQRFDLAKEREKVRCLLLPEVKSHVHARRDARIKEFEDAKEAALQLLTQSVSAHTREYSGVVNGMLEEHERRMTVMAQEEKQVEADLAELLRRTDRLDENRTRLLTCK